MPDDIDRDLGRDDLQAIGLVLVRRGHQDSMTMWCEPDVNPEPLFATAAARGHEPGALVLVFDGEARVYLRPEFQRARWLQRYTSDLARGITRHGLADYLGTRRTLATPTADQAAAARN